MTPLVLIVLAQPWLNANPVFRDTDGGWTLRTTTSASSGPSSGGLTNAELRAAPIFVIVDGGTISVNNFPATQPVSGTLTCNAGTGTLAVSGPLTDAQLRASAVPVSLTSTTITGTVAATQSGTWTDRIVGNAGGVIDAANNATAPANVLVTGAQLQSGAAATNGTAGQVGSVVAGLDHVLYARVGGPVLWSCFLPLTTTATTQCQAAPGAGLRAYVTSMNCSNGAATVQGVDIVFGTGANCGTGTTALTHKYQMGTNALTTSPFQVYQNFNTGLVPTAANAICVRPTAATAFGCTLTGFTAP